MVVQISKFARSKMLEILKKNTSNNLIFSVKGGGCNGFNYHFQPTMEMAKKYDEIVKIDDKHMLIVCKDSLFYLLGTSIDYKKDIMGDKFEFENPNASGKCGCGNSFN